MIAETAAAAEGLSAAMGAGHALSEQAEAHGRFTWRLYEYEGGPLISEGEFENVVCTAGKNVALNAYLAGSSYTVVGPFLGLIDATSFTAVSAADTMTSHAGWIEAGGTNAPAYTGNRGTAVFGAASAGSAAITPIAFTFTSSGTIEGAFLTFGTGAVNTKDNTAGTLYSAGTFGTPQPVISTNVLTVSYSASM